MFLLLIKKRDYAVKIFLKRAVFSSGTGYFNQQGLELFSLWINSISVTIQIKASEHCVQQVLIIMQKQVIASSPST